MRVKKCRQDYERNQQVFSNKKCSSHNITQSVIVTRPRSQRVPVCPASTSGLQQIGNEIRPRRREADTPSGLPHRLLQLHARVLKAQLFEPRAWAENNSGGGDMFEPQSTYNPRADWGREW